MENIILGLLLLKNRTIYELRKRINDGLNLMYSCSTGSIQAAIKKLLQNGHVAVRETTENGKLKKIYSITEKGKTAFNGWVNSPVDAVTAKNPELAKIYFMGFTEKEVRIKLIQSYIDDFKKTCSELEKICHEGEILSDGMKNNEVFYFQLQTALYGKDLMKFNIGWYSRLLKTVQEL